ncbi:MFS transporter [Nonomuraea sp. LPB2021202275-12-8]|uniref:MFS transporter n=1 Tax=Nonomuraea sp. LPB2021202275-12-8 TaxID=3120159 RepID=UPI00300CAB99
MSASMPFRLLRTAVFAVVCLGLGMGAHFFGGGTVSGGAMVAAFGLAACAAFPLAGRERTVRAILPLLGGLQLAVHLLWSMSHAASPAQAIAHAVHPSGGLVPDLGMLVAHSWATALTALWLARGEAVLWGLLRRLPVRLLARLPAVLPPVPETPFFAVAGGEPPVLRSAVLRHVVSRRGPPMVVGTS